MKWKLKQKPLSINGKFPHFFQPGMQTNYLLSVNNLSKHSNKWLALFWLQKGCKKSYDVMTLTDKSIKVDVYIYIYSIVYIYYIYISQSETIYLINFRILDKLALSNLFVFDLSSVFRLSLNLFLKINVKIFWRS